MSLRAKAIESAARAFIDTPYSHAGRVPGIGLDCTGLLTSVADLVKYPYTDAPRDYSQIQDGQTMLEFLRLNMDEVAIADRRPSDVAVFWWDRETKYPIHAGIFVSRPDGLGLVHTYTDVRKVVEHIFCPRHPPKGRMNPYAVWSRRLCHLFRWRGVSWQP